jgi:hypothetical protein
MLLRWITWARSHPLPRSLITSDRPDHRSINFSVDSRAAFPATLLSPGIIDAEYADHVSDDTFVHPCMSVFAYFPLDKLIFSIFKACMRSSHTRICLIVDCRSTGQLTSVLNVWNSTRSEIKCCVPGCRHESVPQWCAVLPGSLPHS